VAAERFGRAQSLCISEGIRQQGHVVILRPTGQLIITAVFALK
jgi:hypothetical protein